MSLISLVIIHFGVFAFIFMADGENIVFPKVYSPSRRSFIALIARLDISWKSMHNECAPGSVRSMPCAKNAVRLPGRAFPVSLHSLLEKRQNMHLKPRTAHYWTPAEGEGLEATTI
jgi:hypothetical protein